MNGPPQVIGIATRPPIYLKAQRSLPPEIEFASVLQIGCNTCLPR
jgi:hypothetical protein